MRHTDERNGTAKDIPDSAAVVRNPEIHECFVRGS